MKKILIIIFSLILISGILTVSIIKLLNTDIALYENTSTDKIQEMISNKETFIVYMYQKSCPSCQEVKPILNDYIKEDKATILAIDINSDKNKNYLSQDLNVKGTPTIIFYNNGIETGRLTSVFTREKFEEKIHENSKE